MGIYEAETASDMQSSVTSRQPSEYSAPFHPMSFTKNLNMYTNVAKSTARTPMQKSPFEDGEQLL